MDPKVIITHCTDPKDFECAEAFLNEQETPSPPVGVRYRFPKGLKKYLDYLSDEHDTWIFEKDDKTLAAGSLIYKTMEIEDKVQKVAITSFMKIKPDAKSTILWARHLLPEIHRRLKEKGCDYIFSYVFESERPQIRSFRQAIKLKDKMPRYFLVRKTSFIMIHGRIPWLSHALKAVRIQVAEPKHSEDIFNFITTQQNGRKIKRIWSEQDVRDLIKDRTKLAMRERLHVCLDHDDNVVGTFLPEEINKRREDILTSASPEALSYFQFQRLLSFIGLTNRPPQRNHPVKSLYLSMIEASNPDVFESMLRFVYKKLRFKNETICYTHYSGNLVSRPPTSFIAGALPMDLYLILPENKKPPEFLKSYWMAPTPDLESIIF